MRGGSATAQRRRSAEASHAASHACRRQAEADTQATVGTCAAGSARLSSENAVEGGLRAVVGSRPQPCEAASRVPFPGQLWCMARARHSGHAMMPIHRLGSP